MKLRNMFKSLTLVSLMSTSVASAGNITSVLEIENYTPVSGVSVFSESKGDLLLKAFSVPDVNIINNNPFAVKAVISFRLLEKVLPSSPASPFFGNVTGVDVNVVTIPANSSYRSSVFEGNLAEFANAVFPPLEQCNSEFRQFITSEFHRLNIVDASGVGPTRPIPVGNDCSSVALTFDVVWEDSKVIQNNTSPSFGGVRKVSPLVVYMKNNYVMTNDLNGVTLAELQSALFEGGFSLASGHSNPTILK